MRISEKLIGIVCVVMVLFSCAYGKPYVIIPIYVEPVYNSKPFKINVGKYSEQLKQNTAKDILKLAKKIKTNIDNVNIETLFVLATRLYDLKQKDEATYWFYTAAFRRLVFNETVYNKRIELSNILYAYKYLLGIYINGYAYGDIDKNILICENVIKDNSSMKSLSVAYPNIAFDDSKLKNAIKKSIFSYRKMIKYMRENKEEIKKARIKNNMENKY